jgi:hypothetical protein
LHIDAASPSMIRSNSSNSSFGFETAIMHNSGVLKGYRHEAEIRNDIPAYEPDFVISNWHFVGDTVEIRRGVLEKLIKSWSEIVRELYTTATRKKLLIFG